MVEINLVCVGNLKEEYLRQAAGEYQKRLGRFCKFNLIELAEERTLEKEKDNILKNLKGYVIALCVEGEKATSQALAKKIEKVTLQSSRITFVIGSSEGLSDEVKQKADFRLSFSDMTFPHQLMRIMLLEQLYRAFTINNNIKYHK